MKTKNACFWIFLLLSGSAYAQMSQKGTVQIFNSNKSPLPGVQLTATDASCTPGSGDLFEYGCQREFPVQLQQTKTGNGYRFSECI